MYTDALSDIRDLPPAMHRAFCRAQGTACKYVLLCWLLLVASPSSAVHAQEYPNLPPIGPSPDMLTVEEGIDFVLQAWLMTPDAEYAVNRIAESDNMALIPKLKQVVEMYAQTDYVGITLNALHALWELGEPQSYFMDLARNHVQDADLARNAVYVMAREPDSTTYAELQMLAQASDDTYFKQDVRTYGDMLEAVAEYSTADAFIEKMDMIASGLLIVADEAGYYPEGNHFFIIKTDREEYLHPFTLWTLKKLPQLAAEEPDSVSHYVSLLRDAPYFHRDPHDGELIAEGFAEYVKEIAFPDGVPAPSTFGATVNAAFIPGQTSLTYTYTVENAPSSTQDVAGFYVDQLIGGLSNLTAPPGWNTMPGTSLLEWEGSGTSPDLIAPGEQETRFSYHGEGLPHIVRYYVWGSSVDFGATPEEIRTSPVQGFTIAPREFPNPYDQLEYLDTLRTYPQRAAEAGWITDPALVMDFQDKYDMARAMLSEGDSLGAEGLLIQVLYQIASEYEAGRLTSESFALLLMNTAVVALVRPDVLGLSGVVPILECVADSGDGTLTAYFGYDDLSVFKVTFNADEKVVWTLTERTAMASANSTPCLQ